MEQASLSVVGVVEVVAERFSGFAGPMQAGSCIEPTGPDRRRLEQDGFS